MSCNRSESDDPSSLESKFVFAGIRISLRIQRPERSRSIRDSSGTSETLFGVCCILPDSHEGMGTTGCLGAIKKSNEGYLIGVYRYTLHPLNGSRTHASVLFPAPTVIITDSQEGQMFRRRRRRQIAAVSDDGSAGSPINFSYFCIAGRVASLP